MALLKGVTFTDYVLSGGLATGSGGAPVKLADNRYQFTKASSGLIFSLGGYATPISAIKVKFVTSCTADSLSMYMIRKATSTVWRISLDLNSFQAEVEYTILMDSRSGVIAVLKDGLYKANPDILSHYSTGSLTAPPANKWSLLLYSSSAFTGTGIVDIESFAYAINLPIETKLLYERKLYRCGESVFGMQEA